MSRVGKSYFVTERKLRKADLQAIITRNPGLPKERIFGIFSQRTGLRFPKIEEYLNELVAAGLVEVNDADEVSPVKVEGAK